MFSQTKDLPLEELIKLKDNYKIENEYIGGMKSGKAVFSQSDEQDVVDFYVTNKDSFLEALRDTVIKNKVIYIPRNLRIDLSGEKAILIYSNTTIIGDRGVNKSNGARLFTSDSGILPLFIVLDNVKIKGIIIEGNDKDVFYKNKEYKGTNAANLNRYKNPVSAGIHVDGNNFILENCELLGWTHTAVHVKRNSKNNIFKFNYFHHNQRYGLGYGIMVDGGEAIVFGNLFDYNRHDIAGTGIIGSSYEVYCNVFLANTHSDSIDMHGGKDRNDNTDIAGSYMYVYNNYFERNKEGRKAAWLRGVPVKQSFFKNNYVKLIGGNKNENYPDKNQFMQINAKGNISIENNFIIGDIIEK
ncbi:hypothetical protein NWE55_13550 [Myroides albus]|uniref:right-handed parallel beta-helix repeat-containing protein n=1 Tax=Myroides albus TaxID=2562892 RepID=UPI0021594470|nr:right-handed parallel beta-helix repeat-containing protein [Myroides albus]UVD79138.1 hypothetical protein NWE55_13550 [Myroides albus]